MKPESLNALLIDRELGELVPEARELLETWLSEHPEATSGVPGIRRTIKMARATLRRFPELARPRSNVLSPPIARLRLMPLAMAASVALLIGGTAWLGFFVGRQSARNPAAQAHSQPAIPAGNAARQASPWAQYAVVSAPGGGLTVVRCDAKSQL